MGIATIYAQYVMCLTPEVQKKIYVYFQIYEKKISPAPRKVDDFFLHFLILAFVLSSIYLSYRLKWFWGH